MHKAYDIFLQAEVTANLAAQNVGFEPYRYECAHCGEEVRLAAADSVYMVSHFRHLSGNNDSICENYLGRHGAISIEPASRKSNKEIADFYYDNFTKMFFLSLRFRDEEITDYDKLGAIFELRTNPQEKAFYTLPISRRFFDSDSPKMIPLEKFSHTYFISNTQNERKTPYEVFKKNGSNVPTFFKVQINDSDYKAKLVSSPILYTNIPYFIIYQSKDAFPWNGSLPSEITVDNTFRFESMGRLFLGKVLTITSKTAIIDALLKSWGYQLETSETLMLLWPPSAMIDEVSTICSGYAYLYSSFVMQAHGNINVHSNDIKKITDNVSRVSVISKIKVHRKNTEMLIVNNPHTTIEFEELAVLERYERVYNVPDGRVHFMFNRFGLTPLSIGQTVFLTQNCTIKVYLSGYLIGCIYPRYQKEWSSKQLLEDILVYYKRLEEFNRSEFDMHTLSETAYQYIIKCDELGLINSAAKRFIEEARL